MDSIDLANFRLFCVHQVVAVHHPRWNKWIRGKSGRKKKAKNEGEVDMIYIWAIDYGCKLIFPMKDVLPLTNMRIVSTNLLTIDQRILF